MFKSLPQKAIFFDLETVPDIGLGRRIYREAIPDAATDESALCEIYGQNGATPDNPKPFLKPMFHKVIVAGALYRSVTSKGVSLKFLTQSEAPEGEMIQKLLDYTGRSAAQLIGWNSDNFDFPVLIQRGMVSGCIVPDICKRPDKPWLGNDYFAKCSDARLDLMKVWAGEYGYGGGKLTEVAIALGLSGKEGMDGSQVYDAWKEGRIDEITRYCNRDVAMTYQIWLRMMRMSGMMTDAQFQTEENQLADLMEWLR